MLFTYPSFLWGLLFVFVPIILHLFDFYRVKKIYFTRVNLLSQIEQQTSKISKLRNLLVLLARILFIIFLVLAFAQPFNADDKLKNELNSIELCQIFIDNSGSMQAMTSNENGLSSAINEAIQITERLPNQTKYKILSLDSDHLSSSILDKEEAKQKIASIGFSSNFISMEDMLIKMNRISNKTNGIVQNFIISDFQRSTLGKINSTLSDSSNKNVNWILLPIKTQNVNNISIDSVYFSTPVIKKKSKVSCCVKIKNNNKIEKAQTQVELLLKDAQQGIVSVELPAGGKKDVFFDFNFVDTASTPLTVKISDPSVKFDNQYYAIARPVKNIRIAIVSFNKETPIQKAFGDQQLFEISISSPLSLNYENVFEADLIILDGFDLFSVEILKSISENKKQNSSLLIFPSENPKDVNLDKIKNINENITLKRIEIDSLIKDIIISPKMSDPFFDGVFDKIDPNVEMPFFKANIEILSPTITILKTKNGLKSFVDVPNHNNHNWISFGSTNNIENGWISDALFVACLYKCAFFSLNNHNQNSFYINNSSHIFDLNTGIDTKSVFKLKNKENEWIPQWQIQNDKLIFTLPTQSLNPGIYQLESGKQKIDIIAFNTSPLESNLEKLEKEEIKTIIQNYKNVRLEDENLTNLNYSVSNSNSKNFSFWKILIILSLIMLMLEILIIRFWSK